MKKLDYVDALRGLAILGVIVVHTSHYGTSNLPNALAKIVSEGARGVQLFYVASAFTLFLSFKSRSRQEHSPVRNFFLRRFFRIAPMYYLGICYYLMQDGLGPRYWLGDATHITPLNILSNFTFLHGLNPYWITSLVPGGWSIAVEMMFYALAPVLFTFITNINRAFAIFLISLFLKAGLHLLLVKYQLISSEFLWSQYLYFYFPAQLPVFALGILLYFIVTESEEKNQLAGKLLLLFSVILLFQIATKINLLLPNHLLFGIAFLILGVALSRYRFPLLVNPLITFIGKISFSMYLIHFAILHWLAYYNFVDFFAHGVLNYAARLLLVIGLTAIVSSITYKLIEAPFQNIGKNIIKRLEKKEETVLQNEAIKKGNAVKNSC